MAQQKQKNKAHPRTKIPIQKEKQVLNNIESHITDEPIKNKTAIIKKE